MGILFLRAHRPINELPAPRYLPPPLDEPPPPDLTPLLGMSGYAQPLVTPIFADIDTPADGKKAIVGLAWNAAAGHEEPLLSAVALDRETGLARWHAGPYPAHWSSDRVYLLQVGDQLVVSDSHEPLHVLDIRTGKATRDPIVLSLSPEHMCLVHDGTPRVLVNEGYEARIKAGHGMQTFWANQTQVSGDDRVVIGFRQGTDGTSEEMAAGFDSATKKVLWSGGLVAPEDTPDRHAKRCLAAQAALANDPLYFLYESGKEPLPYRLVSRTAATGEIAFDEVVPGTAEGSYLTSLSEDSGQVFVIMDQTIHVFNGATGAHLKRFASF